MPDTIVSRARAIREDVNYDIVRSWQEANPGAPVVGYLPAYAPRELIYAAGGLAVGIWGGGLSVEIVQGDNPCRQPSQELGRLANGYVGLGPLP